MGKIIQSQVSRDNDEYYTEAYAVRPLLKYLKQNSTIWCPFDIGGGQANTLLCLQKQGIT